MSSSIPCQGGESPKSDQNETTLLTSFDTSRSDPQQSIGHINKFSEQSQLMNHHQLSALDPTPQLIGISSPPFHSTSLGSHQDSTSKTSVSASLSPGVFAPVVLDTLLKEKMNYRCTYDPALDNSVVKKSAGPQWVPIQWLMLRLHEFVQISTF
ncbi:hypothetical protein DFH28DRAFT_960132 [Melampsora americana]|nr:hypothetical protein DFH28DRAFT_960132 [Melampsora americana]